MWNGSPDPFRTAQESRPTRMTSKDRPSILALSTAGIEGVFNGLSDESVGQNRSAARQRQARRSDVAKTAAVADSVAVHRRLCGGEFRRVQEPGWPRPHRADRQMV